MSGSQTPSAGDGLLRVYPEKVATPDTEELERQAEAVRAALGG